ADSDLATDASDLVLRLGRLLFAAPDWRPTAKASYAVKPPDVLAPTAAEAGSIAAASLKALDACTNLAIHHRAAVQDAAMLRNSQKGHRSRQVPSQARAFLSSYQSLARQGRRTILALGNAAHALTPDATHSKGEIALILHRATSPEHTARTAPATPDFPLTITQALQGGGTVLVSKPLLVSRPEGRQRQTRP
ncbi:hypothetical protein ACFQ07_17595, partial [Actinomadura adrarensis]